MKKNIKLSLFIVLIVLQLIVPSQMIILRELALVFGQEYKFHVEPFDPYDPFRGKYLYINVKDTKFTVNDDKEFESKHIYVLVENDSSGFARFSGISETPPKNGSYIKARLTYTTNDENGNQTIHFEVPFDRYYMPENDAPEAEKLYNEKLREDSNEDVYISVKIHKGTAVLDKLFIGDKTIEEYLKIP